jgi:hypothetical protein
VELAHEELREDAKSAIALLLIVRVSSFLRR